MTKTNREWRILSSVRHPHICGLVDRTRYENPRVRCTKLVMEIMDTSLQVSFRVLGWVVMYASGLVSIGWRP